MNNNDVIAWAKEYGDDEKQGRFSGRFAGFHPSLISPEQKMSTNLPVILLIGDSILGGSCWNLIAEILQGKAHISYIQHPHHCKSISKWLDIWGIDNWHHYHTIFFFDGLHGFPPRVYEEEHRVLTPEIVERLKKVVKNVIWGNCTPIPDNMQSGKKNSAKGPNSTNQMLKDESVINRNISLKIEMEKTNTILIDFYSLLKPNQHNVQKNDDVHFNNYGKLIIATAIAHELLKVL